MTPMAGWDCSEELRLGWLYRGEAGLRMAQWLDALTTNPKVCGST